MKVAILSYPMFTQNGGGLAVQVAETIAALQQCGVGARLIDPYREKLADYDLIHVFGAGNGNHRIVQQARHLGRPVVLSPLIRPHWTKTLGGRARWLTRLIFSATRWEVSTEYRDLETALFSADRLFALGSPERKCLVDAFRLPADRVDIVPNGIPRRFFDAQSEIFLRHYGIEPGFVLCVASVDEHKNQLGLARALASSNLRLVVIGPCRPNDRPYLEALQAVPGVVYLGSLDHADPLLVSAYAAAGVFALASHSEVMPLCVLEALAAGTPVVMTRHHGMDVAGMEAVVRQVDPRSPQEIVSAVLAWLHAPPDAQACKSAVDHLTWERVARTLHAHYRQLCAP